MRLWHTVFAVFLVAMMLAVSRDAAGRVAIVVFVTGCGELVCGLTAVMLLFQTLGALGHSKGVVEGIQSAAATILVTVVAAYVMVGMLAIGASLVERVL